MIFLIIFEDSLNGECRIINDSMPSRIEAIRFCEEHCHDYILAREGDNSERIIYPSDAHGRKFGYFIQNDQYIKGKYNLMWKHTVKGYLMSSVVTERVFSISVCPYIKKTPLMNIHTLGEIQRGRKDLEKQNDFELHRKKILPVHEELLIFPGPWKKTEAEKIIDMQQALEIIEQDSLDSEDSDNSDLPE